MTALPLFVYGTLASGESHAGLLGALPRRPAIVFGALYHLPAGYPAVDLGGDRPVFGQLIEPPTSSVLRLLDHYQGVGEGLFQRVQTRAVLGLEQHPAWIYTLSDPAGRGGRLLPSGRWRSFRRSGHAAGRR